MAGCRSPKPVVAPLSESHYKLQVTISASVRQRLQQIQDLMRHRLPSGDPAAICRAHNGFEWERHIDAESMALVQR